MTKQLAAAAFANGDWEEGLRIWRGICSSDCDVHSLLEYASLLCAYYCFGEAMGVFARLARHPSATSSELLPAARLLFELSRFKACAELTARAVALDPGNPDTVTLHASALERACDKDQASLILCKLLERHPRHVRAIRQLAHIERRNGEIEAAIDRLQNALTHSPTDDDWRLRYELAAVLDRRGDYDGAMQALLAAKQQLAPFISQHRSQWRAMSQRQWEVTQALSQHRLQTWASTGDSLQPPLSLCLMAGFPRSGTTLLEQIVTAHKGCIGTDETGILATQFRDPLILGASSAVAAIAELDAFDVDAITAGREEYVRCTSERIGEAPGQRILIEKDPLLTADLAIPLRLFPEANILMPLRDPRDVVISFFFTIVPLAPNSVASASIEDTCRYYAETMRHWLVLRDRIEPSRWMESRYEDLLANPEQQTRRIATFLDVEWSPAMTSHYRQADRKAIGTPTYDDVSKPLYQRSVERWRNYESWLAPHMDHLTSFLAAFGYA